MAMLVYQRVSYGQLVEINPSHCRYVRLFNAISLTSPLPMQLVHIVSPPVGHSWHRGDFACLASWAGLCRLQDVKPIGKNTKYVYIIVIYNTLYYTVLIYSYIYIIYMYFCCIVSETSIQRTVIGFAAIRGALSTPRQSSCDCPHSIPGRWSLHISHGHVEEFPTAKLLQKHPVE